MDVSLLSCCSYAATPNRLEMNAMWLEMSPLCIPCTCCVGYFSTSVHKVDVLLLISSFFLQLSFFTDEGVQEHIAYLQAFYESHLLSQRSWQRESLFQVLQKQHGGTQYALSSGSSASLLKRSGHSSVLVV